MAGSYIQTWARLAALEVRAKMQAKGKKETPLPYKKYKRSFLQRALMRARSMKETTIFKEFPADHEYEWDRIQRERKEGLRKYAGGNCKVFKKFPPISGHTYRRSCEEGELYYAPL